MTAERTAPVASSRLHSLDGLRGVAALVVVFHHSLLLVPVFAAQYYDNDAIDKTPPLAWLMTYTPLHLIWQGQTAVYVFFVLSGIVLTLPVLNSRRFAWKAYYPQRLLRLYLPVWGAVAFAALTMLVVPRVGDGMSAWVSARASGVNPRGLLLDTTLVTQAGSLVSPLWSLQWEVLFSLLLPLFVWVAVKFRSLLIVKIVLALAVIAVAGAVNNQWVFYLLMFFVGSLFATELERIRAVGSKIDAASHPRLVWWTVLGAGLLLINSTWLLMIARPAGWLINGADILPLIGGVLIVFTATCWSGVRRFLERKPLQWLGLMSFSLYLVHEPIVIASGFLFGPSLVWVAIPVGIVVALLFTWVFYKVIEHPSHLLAQAVKRGLLPGKAEGGAGAAGEGAGDGAGADAGKDAGGDAGGDQPEEPDLVAKALP